MILVVVSVVDVIVVVLTVVVVVVVPVIVAVCVLVVFVAIVSVALVGSAVDVEDVHVELVVVGASLVDTVVDFDTDVVSPLVVVPVPEVVPLLVVVAAAVVVMGSQRTFMYVIGSPSFAGSSSKHASCSTPSDRLPPFKFGSSVGTLHPKLSYVRTSTLPSGRPFATHRTLPDRSATLSLMHSPGVPGTPPATPS